MELVYCVDVQKQRTKDWISEEKYCQSLSCRNILALCKQADNDDSGSCFDHRYEVVVADLDKPWEGHRVTVLPTPPTHLEWDMTGSKLLLVTAGGDCQLWAMKDHLLNKWTCIGSVSVAGEDILSLMWFHNGLQIIFDPDKRDKTQYIEKFVRNTHFTPSLTLFGGSCVEGWILVTASGLISVGVKLGEDEQLISSTENLSPCHLRLTSADIANTGNGDIMIATSDGQLSSAIQCYLVSLQLVGGRTVRISCKNGASLYMKTQMEYSSNNDNQAMRITRVRFMNHDSSDTLLLCCSSTSYSCLEVWQLLEQMMPLHKLFSMNTAPDTSNKTHKWMHKATIPHPSLLTSIAGPKLPMSRNVGETTGFLPYIATGYKDGTIQLIHRYTFQVITTVNVDNLCQQVLQGVHGQNEGGGGKRSRLSVQLSAMMQTGSGCGIVGMHDGKLYLFRTYNGSRDSAMQLSPSSIVLLLEYAMITGQDWWDIFLAVRQGMIMSVCQSLSDNFVKQVHTTQDYVFMRLLSMKMGLFSSYSAGHQKAVDYHARLVLHSISNVVKGILKPRNVTAQDKTPAEKVTLLCNKNTDGDIDNILANLDKEEFHVDIRRKDKTDASLYSLQPLIQWVSDFSLQLLSSAPLFQSFSSFPGSSLLNDSSVLCLLREFLIIFKIWGLNSPGCMPVFTTTSVNLDLLKHIYKLLTRAWLCSKEGRTIEFDDNLLDECSVLPSKVLIPSASQSFRMDSNGFSVFTQPLPLTFSLGEEPEYLYQKRLNKTQRGMPDINISNSQHHDIVRQIHLGTHVSGETRQCCRCGCRSLLKCQSKSTVTPPATNTMNSLEQRWARNCLCMGHWKLITES